ncbi:YciE/YciF ferroxidase family protein [Costertonia aggregata]|uniref:Ferritin-like domain-containing protein n=1 Tax=Costertonia aggregata TaxID=343403 RepID=A0A7H9ASX3_9FLAO|nr:ferritin-like domain-containing protein [Costertonia aggregata]QLG46549.1 ferritin-like domain-containing protein [Costertonia aggregata]
MKTLNDLFEHQLKDLYSAENQLLDALPKVLENVSDSELKNSLESHKEETKKQKERIIEICDSLGINPSGEECKAMKGLIEETNHFLKEDADADVKDAGIIANCQRIEHYEISGYGTAVKFAKQLGHHDIAQKLQTTLDEEYNADEKLDNLAESRINEEAQA